MSKRVGKHVGGGREPEDEREERERMDALREALSFWTTGVSILAVREGDAGPVHALTVGSFIPVTFDPPLVLASLGPNASALAYLKTDTPFAISILADDQRDIASRYADTFPVGSTPFRATGAPLVEGCLAWLACEVDELLVRGDHTLVVGRVVGAGTGDERPALAYFRRGYHRIG